MYIQKEVNGTFDKTVVEEVAKTTDQSLRGMIHRTLQYWKHQNDEKNIANAICKTVEMTKFLPDSRPLLYTQWALANQKDINRCMPIIQVFLYLKRHKTLNNTMVLRFRKTIVGYRAIKKTVVST